MFKFKKNIHFCQFFHGKWLGIWDICSNVLFWKMVGNLGAGNSENHCTGEINESGCKLKQRQKNNAKSY